MRVALSKCGEDKALDGFDFSFIKAVWDIVK